MKGRKGEVAVVLPARASVTGILSAGCWTQTPGLPWGSLRPTLGSTALGTGRALLPCA